MVKKIFKIFGIVFGSVLAFVGGVFGVMAAMGKFKTPILYPEVLMFVDEEQMIIAGIPNGIENEDPTIYHFVLQGTNSNTKYEVNRKTCYLWFSDNIGSDLITLCDERGNPLQKTNDNRYTINCNEPVYYTLNPIADDATTDGKVVLTARSENGKTMPDVPLTIWIDREIDSIFIEGYEESISTENGNEQTISLGVNFDFDFKYVVDSELSLKPVSKDSAKEVELYYVATGYNDDYIRVTQEEVENIDSPLNKIITYADGVFKFKSETPGNYTFKIAAFKTYEYKSDYLELIDGQIIDNPNFHRVTSLNEYGIENMSVTTLNVTVENVEISKVGFLGGNAVLNLYSENDYMTLDGTSGVAGAKENNLELYMQKGEGGNLVYDYSRFDEVQFVDFSNPAIWADKQPEFVSSANVKLTAQDLAVADKNKSKVRITENGYILESVVFNGTTYYCNNGVAVYNPIGNEIKLLTTGSYLNFYVENGSELEVSTHDYIATEINEGKNKSWNIITKGIPEENVYLGILVVNTKGKFVFSDFFDTIPVNLNVVPIEKEVVKKQETLNITFTADDVKYASANFSDFITVSGGSYNACVLMTRKTDACIVDTIDNIMYVESESEQYVLVGYVDESTGKFVNSVRINGNISSTNKTCEIIMLQLQNGFKQDIYDIFNNEVLGSGLTLTPINTIKFFEEDAITINGQYMFNANLVEVEFYDNFVSLESEENKETSEYKSGYAVYENTTAHTIIVKSLNEVMLTKICEFYELETNYADFIDINYENKLINLFVDEENNVLRINYDTSNALNDDDTAIMINLVGLGEDVNLGTLYVKSGSPDNIVFNAAEINNFNKLTHQLKLTTKELAEEDNNTNYIKVVVDYNKDESRYTYKFYLIINGVQVNDTPMDSIFNDEITTSVDLLFQAAEDKGQKLNINYDSLDKSIFDTTKIDGENLINAVGKSGSTVIAVTIGRKTQYVKLVADTSNFVLTTKSNKLSFENVYKLTDVADFDYVDDETAIESMSKDLMIYVDNLKTISYGDGMLVTLGDRETTWSLNKETDREVVDDKEVVIYETILTITSTGSDWEFSYTNIYVPLTISFELSTIAGTKTIQITFRSGIQVSMNAEWSENKVLYAGTRVLFNSNAEGTVPIFKVEGVAADDVIGYKINNTTVSISNGIVSIKEDYISIKATIEVLLNGVVIAPFDFVIKPNVVAEIAKTEFESGVNTAISTIYSLKKFKDIVYGNSLDDLYTATISAEDATLKNLTDLTSDNFSISTSGSEENLNPVLTYVDGMLKIGEITELKQTKTRTIYLNYTDANGNVHVISSDKIKINNKYELSVESDLTFKVKKEYNVFACVEGFTLETITADELTFVISTDKTTFIINNFIDCKFDDVEVLLTFKKGEEILTYTTKINVLPYSPEYKEVDDIPQAFSGSTYDLLASRFDLTSLENDDNVEKLLILGVEESDGESITSEIIGSYNVGGFIKGNVSHHCLVVFKDNILNEQRTVYVRYQITYANGDTFEDRYELTIKNRQKITIEYPEEGLTLDSVNFKFLAGYEEEGKALSGATTTSANAIYTLRNVNYESLLIYTDEINIVNFKEDANKLINRVQVENEANANTEFSTSEIPTITLIAYENNFGMSDYALNQIDDKYDDCQVRFGQATQGIFGTLLFKIESASGYVKYYNIYVFCKGSSTNLNTTKKWEVVAYNGGYIGNGEVAQSVAVNTDTTLESVVASVGINSSLYAGTELYLLSVNQLGGENLTPRTKIKETDVINISNYFTTVTIGLFYSRGYERCSYGTVVVYVQPMNSITINGVLDYELNYKVPNGKFTADIAPESTSILNPFEGTAPTLTILEDSLSEQGYKLLNGCVVDKDVTAEAMTDADVIIKLNSANTSIVDLKKRVAKTLTFTVKYEFNGTVALCTYSYGATVLPDKELLNNKQFVIGEFKEGFVNTIDIIDSTEGANKQSNLDAFLGTYAPTNSYSIDKVELQKDNENPNLLTFTQTAKDEIVKVTITYTNYEPEEGDTNTRTFTFKVKAGVYIDATSQNGDSGLSATTRKRTDETKGSYTNQVGSQLEIKYDFINEVGKKYHSFIIGDLKIYTVDQSYLKLTFDTPDYVLNNADFTGGGFVEFVHTPQDVASIMTVKVMRENGENDEEYSQRNFYITIAQTYSALEANYLIDEANHENVLAIEDNNSIENLHSTLLESRRIILKDVDGNVVVSPVLYNMGFATKGNPNYITFTIGENATIRSFGEGSSATTGIVFNSVSNNTITTVFLNNNAGMPEIGYNYQIMAGDKVDGLDYDICSGYYGTYGTPTVEYVSIALDDNTDITTSYTSGRYVIGQAIDLNNNSIFTLDSYKFSTTELIVDIEPTRILEGKPNHVGNYTNAIQYVIRNTGYNFYLTMDLDSKKLELIVQRTPEYAKANFVLTINASGVNGNSTMISNLEISINNFSVNAKFADNYDTSIYSDYLIDLTSKFEFVGIQSENVTFELEDSSYILDGKLYTISAAEVDNDLFKFDGAKKQIQTKAIGSDITATINIKISFNNYVLKIDSYKLNIYLNMQFVVNGDDLEDNIDNSSPETYFILTNGEANFPLTKSFISKSEMASMGDTQDGYYKVLAFDLYRRKLQGNDNVEAEAMDRGNIKVELYSAINNNILTVNNNAITFYKDYTGEVELKLSVPTDNGTYYVIWTIYITGLLDMNYSIQDNDFARLLNDGVAFSAGSEVNFVSGSASTGVAITMTRDTKFSDDVKFDDLKDGEGKDVEGVTITYNYKIFEFNNETNALSNEDLFKTADEKYLKGEGAREYVIRTDGIVLRINLPSVPSTSTHIAQSYLVVYEIYTEYLGLAYSENPSTNKVQVFYVTYEVINYQTVEAYIRDDRTSSADVNVSSLENGKILDLFNYEMSLVSGGDEYKLVYSDGEITLNDGTITYCYDSRVNDVEEKTFITDDANDGKYIYNVLKNTLSFKSVSDEKSTLINGEWNTNYHHDKSVFSSNFKNIFEYKSFIENLMMPTSKIVLTTDKGVHEYSLIEFEDQDGNKTGRYGIDLTEVLGIGEVLFSNEMQAELAIVDNGVKVTVIDAYSNANTTGFRLYTTEAIRAKEVKLSTMFLSSYFSSSELTLNDTVIGVGTPETSWVQTTGTLSGSIAKSGVVGTISIPNGNGYNEYYIKQATYIAEPKVQNSRLYNLEKTFNYIEATDGKDLIVPNYGAVGIETTFFKITYNPSLDGNVKLDLTKAFKVWTMSTVDAQKQLSSDSATIFANLNFTCSEMVSLAFSNTNKTISIDSSVLDAYKTQHPSTKNYPTINTKLNVGNVTLCFDIVFSLYSNVKIETELDGSNDINIDLIDKLYIPIQNGNAVVYNNLSDDNKNKIQSVIELDTDYAIYDKENTQIVINNESVNKYFEDNITVSVLIVDFVLYSTEGNSLNFQIHINKSV